MVLSVAKRHSSGNQDDNRKKMQYQKMLSVAERHSSGNQDDNRQKMQYQKMLSVAKRHSSGNQDDNRQKIQYQKVLSVAQLGKPRWQSLEDAVPKGAGCGQSTQLWRPG